MNIPDGLLMRTPAYCALESPLHYILRLSEANGYPTPSVVMALAAPREDWRVLAKWDCTHLNPFFPSLDTRRRLSHTVGPLRIIGAICRSWENRCFPGTSMRDTLESAPSAYMSSVLLPPGGTSGLQSPAQRTIECWSSDATPAVNDYPFTGLAYARALAALFCRSLLMNGPRSS